MNPKLIEFVLLLLTWGLVGMVTFAYYYLNGTSIMSRKEFWKLLPLAALGGLAIIIAPYLYGKTDEERKLEEENEN